MHSFTCYIVDKQAHWSNIAQAAYLGCAELTATPLCLKLDDSSSPRGNVEECCGGLGLRPNCLLLAVGCSSKCMDLAMCVLGGFA